MVIVFVGVQSFAQKTIKKYVRENIVSIKNISPDSLDFSDLEAIGNAIGDSRIVMLGEQDHGDAPTFLAKTRLIKYLHERKGFDVLAFESDFYALTDGWDAVEKKKDKIEPFLRKNIFSIWTNCMQCDDLFYNYISKTYETKSSLAITGFDSQSHGDYSKEKLKKFVDSILSKWQVPLVKSKEYNTFLNFLDSSRITKDTLKYNVFINQINAIIDNVPEEFSNSYGLLLLRSVCEDFKSGLAFLRKEKNYMEIRDKQMAENLKWLAYQKYRDKKIIVWAHSAHILKNPDLIKKSVASEGWANMGHFFTKDSLAKKETYLLGFTSKNGMAGRITNPNKYRASPAVKNGFENWVPANVNYAFVDFGIFKKLHPAVKEYFPMKGKWHGSSEAIWTEVFDGIFYIRDMYPCDKSKLADL
ncbi:erythromycin esterase family protein [Pedobacter ureilyticus]|uniref:Erythromycin esterase family protein n=1 Tax=Pedobacter ureilyticus TaxID=1393051 RepID=A0ABW9J117_9SPHI|nr:erythromycin esterase family protein [Pedobacter helvus]